MINRKSVTSPGAKSEFDFDLYPSENNSDEDSDEAGKTLMKRMCSQLVLGRLPVPEPEIFYNDPLMFLSWKNSFKALITSRSIPKEERVYYLRKYVGGEAKMCIEGFLTLCTPDSFDEAFKLLEKRFGYDFVVANAYRQKLRKWPKIYNDDHAALRKFSDYLHQVEVAKRSLHCMRFLDDEQENMQLLMKLPDFCQKRWARVVHKAEMTTHNFPDFLQFVSFCSQRVGYSK